MCLIEKYDRVSMKGDVEMEEGKKIYIGNLEYGVVESDLAKLFEEKGINAKEIAVIMDKYTGRSKGFAFAEFETEEEAQKAIEALDGQDLNGRTLRVSKAQKREPRSDKFGGGGGGGGPRRDRFGGGGGGGGRFDRGNRY